MKKLFAAVYDSYEFSSCDDGFGFHFDGYCLVTEKTEEFPDGFVLVDDYVEDFKENMKVNYPEVYKEVMKVLDSLDPGHVRTTYYLDEIVDCQLNGGYCVEEGVYRKTEVYLPAIFMSKKSAEEYVKERASKYRAHNNLRIVELEDVVIIK